MSAEPVDEDILFAHHLTVVDGTFRLNHKDAPERAQRLLSEYTKRAVDRQIEVDQLTRRLAKLSADGATQAERARQIGEIVRYHTQRKVYSGVDGPTAETITKPPRRDPILVLVEKGHLEPEHEIAARQIAECFEYACRAGMAKARDYRTATKVQKAQGRKPEDLTVTRLDMLHAKVYLPWTRSMSDIASERGSAFPRGHNTLPFVLDIVNDGVSLDAACKRRRVGWQRGLADLKIALGAWWGFVSDFRESADD